MRMWPVWWAGMSEMMSFWRVVVLAEARLVRRVEICSDREVVWVSSGLFLGLSACCCFFFVCGSVGFGKASFP